MNERGAAGTDGTAGGRCGAAAAARQLESPGRARVGAGAARCHLAAAVAAGGAGETIKVSRRSACTLRGNFLGRAEWLAPCRSRAGSPAAEGGGRRPGTDRQEGARPALSRPGKRRRDASERQRVERQRVERHRSSAGPAGRGLPAPTALGHLHASHHPDLHHRSGFAG